MVPQNIEPNGLPLWMAVFAFVVSVFLAILKVIEWIMFFFKKSSLEIALTREVFFRILEKGESLYVNAVLIAYDKGTLITDVKATLKKINGATKEYELRVSDIGEKFRNPEGLPNYYFE